MAKRSERLKNIVYTGLFSALCAVSTLIAFPAGIGYVNAGDMIVLLGAFTLSPLQAMIAAGIGSALADLICGYALYAPATFVIKAVMALSAYSLYHGLKKLNVPPPLCVALSAVFAELCMALGYLAYEWSVLGYGPVALSSIPANLIQGAFGCVGGILLYYVLKNTKLTDKLPAI